MPKNSKSLLITILSRNLIIVRTGVLLEEALVILGLTLYFSYSIKGRNSRLRSSSCIGPLNGGGISRIIVFVKFCT